MNFCELIEELQNIKRKDDSTISFLRQKLADYNKDTEIQKLKNEIEEIRNHSLLIMSNAEMKAEKEFRQNHYEKHGKRKNLNTYVYTLTGTGLGNVIEIACPFCGEKKDITDIRSW